MDCSPIKKYKSTERIQIFNYFKMYFNITYMYMLNKNINVKYIEQES